MEFHKIGFEDRQKMNEILKLSDYITAENSFSNAMNWQAVYNSEVAYYSDELMVIRINVPVRSHLYPVGKGDIKGCVSELMADCEREGVPFFMHGIQEEGKANLESLFPNTFRLHECRNSADYVYSVERLAVLSGKKLIKKRNHINKFKRLYDDWSYEAISEANMADVIAMKEDWYAGRNYLQDEELAKEKIAVDNVIENFKTYDLEGGLIRVGNKVIAFTIGSRLNSETFIIHVEKAFVDYDGSYAIINQEFILNNLQPQGYKYVNREEDMGNEGLRKAKLSYDPERIVLKYRMNLLADEDVEGPCEG